jgi:hypothetical protein
MPKKLEKINLRSMILTNSLLSGLTLTSVPKLGTKRNTEVSKQRSTPNVVEILRKDELEDEEDNII